MEFLGFKFLHHTSYGNNRLNNLSVAKEHLRLQCERKIRSRLINLVEAYIKCKGDTQILEKMLLESFSGDIFVFKTIVFLIRGKYPPTKAQTLAEFEEIHGKELISFQKIHSAIYGLSKFSTDELKSIFTEHYSVFNWIANRIDSL
jgi:hypothetical protein